MNIKQFYKNCAAIFTLLTSIILLLGCEENKNHNYIRFAVSAEYPPFEYYHDNAIQGFDIELAQLIAKELSKKAVFENMQFSTILAALQSNSVDAAISTITITPERTKNFDFSNFYYIESMALVHLKNQPIYDKSQLTNKKIACQLGTTMEIWLKKYAINTKIIAMDSNAQVIEALKAGHVDGALVDSIQGATFSQKNPNLSYHIIAKSDTGYGIAFKKNSPLKTQMNIALENLEKNGKLTKLKQKWLGEDK